MIVWGLMMGTNGDDMSTDVFHNYGKALIMGSTQDQINDILTKRREEEDAALQDAFSEMASSVKVIARNRKRRASRAFWGSLLRVVLGVIFAAAFAFALPMAQRAVNQINASAAELDQTLAGVNGMLSDTGSQVEALGAQIDATAELANVTIEQTKGTLADASAQIDQVDPVIDQINDMAAHASAVVTEGTAIAGDVTGEVINSIDVAPVIEALDQLEASTAAAAAVMPQVTAAVHETSQVIGAAKASSTYVRTTLNESVAALNEQLEAVNASLDMDAVNSGVAAAGSAVSEASSVLSGVSEGTAAVNASIEAAGDAVVGAVEAAGDAVVDTLSGAVETLDDVMESADGENSGN